MSEQQEPIKKERIDNLDGTYTVNEVYDKPNFGCYLSCIEVFDSTNRMLCGTYYEDKKFKKLLCTDTREYLDNGQCYKTVVFEKHQKDGYISHKCLCDCNEKEIKAWFYEDKHGTNLLIYREIEYLENDVIKTRNVWYKNNYSNEVYQDSEKRIMKEIIYNNTEFRNASASHEYFYNDDNSYKVICLLETNADISCDSTIGSAIDYFNNKNQHIKGEYFCDKNFTQLDSLSTSKYSKNGEYTVKTSYLNCNEDGWQSTIEKYDKNSRYVYGEYYQDRNFRNLGQKAIKKYYKDGGYKYIEKRTIPNENDWYEREEVYDKNDRYLSGIYKTSSKEHNQIIKKSKWLYNEDNTYDIYCSYIKQDEGKSYLSYIERCTDDDKFVFSKFYKDRNFKELYSTCDRKYITDGHYINNTVKDDIFEKVNYKSRTMESNTDEMWEKVKYYKNNDFTELLVSTYEYINANGNREKQIVYENDQGGWFSSIFERDEQNRVIKQQWYSDKEFKNVYVEENLDYKDDSNYTVTTIFHRPLEDNEYHNIEFYKNDKLNKKIYYKDKELTELYATEHYDYLIKKTINKTVFEETYENMQSLIEYENTEGKAYYSLGYLDKEFKNLYRTTWAKYTKNSQICLRIYAQKQGNYNTEIEKYDNNKKLIYKKQYNTNFVFAKILYWLMTIKSLLQEKFSIEAKTR